jgi:microcystin-dependent protein
MSAQLIQIGPFFHQGALCGAALLEHYAAGSNTLKNIWSDSDATITLAQPFVSDANGVFTFFADGAYKLIIKKANGEVLYTIDNWDIQSTVQSTLTKGASVATASSMDIGSATWAHWTGSTNVSTLTGSALWYWAVADGSFTLIHSGGLIMPDSRNRKVLAGDTILLVNEGSNIWRLAGHMQKEGGWTGRQAVTVAASATLAVPTDGDFIDVSGGTTITAVASASAGYRFRARFTGTGLNLTQNVTSLISPWGRDYRTTQNEILEFQSLGSGNWIFYSLNGPKERIGTIISNGDPTGTQSAGFLVCDGSAVSRTTYSGLWSLLGTQFGAGDGTLTFNVPDERGRVEIMVDGSANRITSASTNGANADTLGGTGGAQTHTLVLSETPAHTHNYTAIQNSAGAVVAGGADKASVTSATTSQGGDGAHSNTQPWIAVNKYIRF